MPNEEKKKIGNAAYLATTYLDELYHRGKTKDKKHRFQPTIISRYIRCVDYLAAVLRPEELYQYNSLRFEALHGDKEGKFSIRVNDQYR